MSKLKKFNKSILLLSSCMLLLSCSSSHESAVQSNPANQAANVSISEMTSVPVLDGGSTKGVLFIHNTGSGVARNIKLSSGLELTHTDNCKEIAANSYCAVNFQTPSLSAKQGHGSARVSLSYSDGSTNRIKTSYGIVNYEYRSSSSLEGVNLMSGGLKVIGKAGETKYVVAYMYAGGTAGKLYKDVRLTSNSVGVLSVNNGFSNGSEVAVGEVVAVELAVHLQGTETTLAQITPSYTLSDNAKVNQGYRVAGSSLNGTSLQVGITPGNLANLVVGNLAVLNVPNGGESSISVLNNGNVDYNGITVEASGGNASNVIITNNCTGTIAAYASNSCTVGFKVAGESAGSTTINFKSGTGVIASQQLYWYNPSGDTPILYITNSTNSLEVGRGVNSESIVMTITNPSGVTMTNITTSINNTTGFATWNQASNSCGSSLAPGEQCAITGSLNGVDVGYNSAGQMQLTVNAQNNGQATVYNFTNTPINYLVVYSVVNLTISPSSVTGAKINADGVTTQLESYTISNISGTTATITSLDLTTSSTSAKPVIDSSSTCILNGTIANNSSCVVVLKYGPVPTSVANDESGVATLNLGYKGGSPEKTGYSLSGTYDYSVYGYGAYVSESVVASGGITGLGTSASPYIARPVYGDSMKITYTYTNPWAEALSNFKLTLTTLPTGFLVDASSTCPTNGSTISLAAGASCSYVVSINRATLATSAFGGSVASNITSPALSWTTATGTSKNKANYITYATYQQPTIVASATNQSKALGSMVMTLTAANASYSSALSITVKVASPMFSKSPTNASSNCTVSTTTDSESNTVVCNLATTTTGTYTYNTFNKGGVSTNGSTFYACQLGCNYTMPLSYTLGTDSYAGLSGSASSLILKSTASLSLFLKTNVSSGCYQRFPVVLTQYSTTHSFVYAECKAAYASKLDKINNSTSTSAITPVQSATYDNQANLSSNSAILVADPIYYSGYYYVVFLQGTGPSYYLYEYKYLSGFTENQAKSATKMLTPAGSTSYTYGNVWANQYSNYMAYSTYGYQVAAKNSEYYPTYYFMSWYGSSAQYGFATFAYNIRYADTYQPFNSSTQAANVATSYITASGNYYRQNVYLFYPSLSTVSLGLVSEGSGTYPTLNTSDGNNSLSFGGNSYVNVAQPWVSSTTSYLRDITAYTSSDDYAFVGTYYNKATNKNEIRVYYGDKSADKWFLIGGQAVSELSSLNYYWSQPTLMFQPSNQMPFVLGQCSGNSNNSKICLYGYNNQAWQSVSYTTSGDVRSLALKPNPDNQGLTYPLTYPMGIFVDDGTNVYDLQMTVVDG